MKCRWCEAEVANLKNETLAAARWGWTLAPDSGLGRERNGDPVPGFWYACPDCSDPEYRDAWGYMRRDALSRPVGKEQTK